MLSRLAKKVYERDGDQAECLALGQAITGDHCAVGMLCELLRVVQDFVVRGRLTKLKYLMINGQCMEAGADEEGHALKPICVRLVQLASSCSQLGRPLHGVNWAEMRWSRRAAFSFAGALAEAHIPKFQAFTKAEPMCKEVRDRVRKARLTYEAGCRQRDEVPWWRDNARSPARVQSSCSGYKPSPVPETAFPAAFRMPTDADLEAFHARLWESGGYERGEPLASTVIDLGPTCLQKWASQYVEWAGLHVALDNVHRQTVLASDVDIIILTTAEEYTSYGGMAFDALALPPPDKIYGFNVVLSRDRRWLISLKEEVAAGSKRTRATTSTGPATFSTHDAYEVDFSCKVSNGFDQAKLCSVVGTAFQVMITVLFQCTEEPDVKRDKSCGFTPMLGGNHRAATKELRVDAIFLNERGLRISKVRLFRLAIASAALSKLKLKLKLKMLAHVPCVQTIFHKLRGDKSRNSCLEPDGFLGAAWNTDGTFRATAISKEHQRIEEWKEYFIAKNNAGVPCKHASQSSLL